MDETWQSLLSDANRQRLEEVIAQRIGTKRWFGAKARTIGRASVLDSFPLSNDARVLLIELGFADGPPEVYQLPLVLAPAAGPAPGGSPSGESSAWAELAMDGQRDPVVLRDATEEPACCAALLDLFEARESLKTEGGEISVVRASAFESVRGTWRDHLRPRSSQAEQSNTSIQYGDRLILKLYRRIEQGVNPEWELNAFLDGRFSRIPRLCGAIEYRKPRCAPWTLALLQSFIRNQGDAWSFTLAKLSEDVETLLAGSVSADEMPIANGDLLAPDGQPRIVDKFFGPSLFWARLLARRTAEMHLALASGSERPFAPEPFALCELQSWATSIQHLAEQTFALVALRLSSLGGVDAERARRVLSSGAAIDAALEALAQLPTNVRRIRIHGDYHLGQVLVTDDDFVILDFEGEPARPLAERRHKQLALRDVAGMVRSFHYACCTVAARLRERCPADAQAIEHWTAAWYSWISAAFVETYRQTAGSATFVPSSDGEFRQLLQACILEKAFYELRYELNNRPGWVYLPLAALEDLLSQ